MSLQDEMAAVKRRLDDLTSTVERLERSLAHADESDFPPGRPDLVEDLVIIPEAPYNSTLWTDSDDEGLGVRDRHAP